jgi:hypothetical protein
VALFLLFVLIAVALGIIGVAVKGLLYLLAIAVVVFLADVALAGLRHRRRPRVTR